MVAIPRKADRPDHVIVTEEGYPSFKREGLI
jgi:DNA repair protein RadC